MNKSREMVDHQGRDIENGDIIFEAKARCACGCGHVWTTKQTVRWRYETELGIHQIAERIYRMRADMQDHIDGKDDE